MTTSSRYSYVPVEHPAEQDFHQLLQERWANLMALFSGVPEPHPRTSTGPSNHKDEEETQDSDSDSDYSSDDDTSLAEVHEEMQQLHFDLDFTERSIVDLEIEFVEDLEALMEGLETAFEHLDDQDIVKALQAQEAQMSQSTRSNFKAAVAESVEASFRKRGKRRRRSAPTIELLDETEREEEENSFHTWFESIWSAIEGLFQQYAVEQQQKSPGSQTKTFLELWFET